MLTDDGIIDLNYMHPVIQADDFSGIVEIPTVFPNFGGSAKGCREECHTTGYKILQRQSY